MTRALAAVGACALAAAAVALGSGGAAPVPRASADALVDQLGSPRFTDREAAARALEALGPAAMPALEPGTRSGNPEISRRASEILARLRRQSDSSRLLAPKKVKLPYRDTPLGTALNDLKARTGITLALDPDQVANPLRPVTVETEELPVWEAVEAFCKAAGLREVVLPELPVPKMANTQRRGYYMPPPPPPSAEAVAVTLADGRHRTLPGTRSTAVRVLALPPSFPGHRVYLGAGQVVMNFDVAPTPGLNWQQVNGVRITKLIDEAGRFGTGGTLTTPEVSPHDPFGGPVVMAGGPGGGRFLVMRWDPDGNPILPTEHPNPRVVPVPLKVATRSARSLRLLEGVVLGEIRVLDQPIATIDRAADRQGATISGVGGKTVSIEEVTRSGIGAAFRIVLRSESPQQRSPFPGLWGGPMWPERAAPVNGGIQVRGMDARGQAFAPASTQMTGINDDGMTQTIHLDATFREAVPAKLVVIGPAAIPVEVPFRMENVLLP
jgi:hypothetical protein